ncbi:hypothetical protein H0H92_003799 [Tricholoma furcatifolium]|nr:hypothetical protein H0H92_003799 [Tricholoma furcatifolium]
MHLQQVLELWFEDADMIFYTEGQAFRISGLTLASNSSVFEEMLTFPQPEVAEKLDGCPVIHIPDAAFDVTCFFKAIFYPNYFEAPPARTDFKTLLAMLRLSHKYQVGYLSQRALQHLSTAYPSTLQAWDTRNETRTFPAIKNFDDEFQLLRAAQKFSASWVMPSLLYSCGAYPMDVILDSQVWKEAGDLVVEKNAILLGYTEQFAASLRVVRFLVQPKTHGCTDELRCYKKKLTWFDVVDTWRPSIPLEIWDESDWKRYAKEVCAACLEQSRKAHIKARMAVWEDLPRAYRLPPWDKLEIERDKMYKSRPVNQTTIAVVAHSHKYPADEMFIILLPFSSLSLPSPCSISTFLSSRLITPAALKMRFYSVLFTLAAPLLASAAPIRFFGKRAAADVLVLQFADVLEQMESTFYSQALSTFQTSDFITAGYSSSQLPIQQFQNIQSDEATHSQTLEAAITSLGGSPITNCQFDFSSVLTDVATMVAAARVVENLGVGAYLGGATLLTDPSLLAAAGSILTVEARHETILNVLSASGSAIPAAFDIALAPNEALAVAAPFISGCNIPITGNTPLSLTNTGTVAPGTLLTFQASTMNGTIPNSSLYCQMLVGGAADSIPFPLSQCVVPQGINGPVALFITSDGQPLANDVVTRAQNSIVAGPMIAFIDTEPELLGQMVLASGISGSSTSTSTTTISPAQASSIIASASSAATATVAGSGTSTSTSTTTISPAEASSIISSASSASATATADASSATASVSDNIATSGGPNMLTGPSQNGAIIVNGWSTT